MDDSFGSLEPEEGGWATGEVKDAEDTEPAGDAEPTGEEATSAKGRRLQASEGQEGETQEEDS